MTADTQLIEPTLVLEEEFKDMARDYLADRDPRYQTALEDYHAFVWRIEQEKRGKHLPAGYAPTTIYWLVDDGHRVLGCSRIRHHLTPALEIEGGHIGYDIRPSARHKGYGIRILELSLEKARNFGFDRVMVTCDQDNIASGKIIEKHGGVLSGTATSPRTGKMVNHYWIDLL